jgi:hypothetical protein
MTSALPGGLPAAIAGCTIAAQSVTTFPRATGACDEPGSTHAQSMHENAKRICGLS